MLRPPDTITSPLASRVAVWSTRATFMLPVLLNPPEPAGAGAAGLTAPIANKLTKRSERFALNLLLTDSEETIASGTLLIVEVVNNLAAGLLIGFIPVRSQRRTLRVAAQK